MKDIPEVTHIIMQNVKLALYHRQIIVVTTALIIT